MEPTFIALREYLADGLERPFLNLGDDQVEKIGIRVFRCHLQTRIVCATLLT